ncbi:MAG: ParB/RepB/Spo0J family partition protein [Acutalibacteraceae bacterium]
MRIKEREEKIEQFEKLNLSLEELTPFQNHPYKVTDDEEMEQLMESIKENGVLTPIIVTHLDLRTNKFDIVSGHRRYEACKKLGIKTIPAIYKEMSYDEAVIAMVDSNLQREHILPSEKARAYKMKNDAMKSQGKRTDLTSGQVGPKLTSETLSNEDSSSQVKRYIRLNNLIPELLTMVDEGKIALTPAVELSYLNVDEQKWVLETIQSEECTPTLAQAKQMKNLSQAQMLNMDEVFSIMKKPKANQVETLKIKAEPLDKYLGRFKSQKEKEDYLVKACEYYSRYLQRQKDRGAR